jgi:hypothetical protein
MWIDVLAEMWRLIQVELGAVELDGAFCSYECPEGWHRHD